MLNLVFSREIVGGGMDYLAYSDSKWGKSFGKEKGEGLSHAKDSIVLTMAF